MAIDPDRLGQLARSEEGQYFDRKSLFEGPPGNKQPRDRRSVRDQVAEYAAAFANAEGGTLLLGVEDDGTVTGHRYPAEVVDRILETPRQRLKPPLQPGARAVIDGCEVLVFEVEAAASAVMVTGDGFPLRVHKDVFQFGEEQINSLKRQGLVESAEARKAPGLTIGGLDEKLIARASGSSGAVFSSPAEYLIQRRLADRQGDGLALRASAVLLFARDARVIEHPSAGVRIFRVQGTQRLTGTSHNVQELPRIEGNLPDVLVRTREVLGTLIRKSARLHELFFREMPEYPTLAWQEAVVNAVAHRDYGIRGRCVEVWLFDDRMEVVSPGGLLPEVSLAKLRVGTSCHASRNPRIARVLAELGIMREQGEGIPRMFEEMERSFLRLPELDASESEFRVALRNEPLFVGSDPAWVRQVQSSAFSVRQKRALIGLAGREFANNDYRSLNQVDRDTAYQELHQLVDQGALVTVGGRGRGARYRVRSQPAADSAQSGEIDSRLLERMTARGFLTHTDFAALGEQSRAVVQRRLARMVEAGLLIPEGSGRWRQYRPGPRWPPG